MQHHLSVDVHCSTVLIDSRHEERTFYLFSKPVESFFFHDELTIYKGVCTDFCVSSIVNMSDGDVVKRGVHRN